MPGKYKDRIKKRLSKAEFDRVLDGLPNEEARQEYVNDYGHFLDEHGWQANEHEIRIGVEYPLTDEEYDSRYEKPFQQLTNKHEKDKQKKAEFEEQKKLLAKRTAAQKKKDQAEVLRDEPTFFERLKTPKVPKAGESTWLGPQAQKLNKAKVNPFRRQAPKKSEIVPPDENMPAPEPETVNPLLGHYRTSEQRELAINKFMDAEHRLPADEAELEAAYPPPPKGSISLSDARKNPKELFGEDYDESLPPSRSQLSDAFWNQKAPPSQIQQRPSLDAQFPEQMARRKRYTQEELNIPFSEIGEHAQWIQDEPEYAKAAHFKRIAFKNAQFGPPPRPPADFKYTGPAPIPIPKPRTTRLKTLQELRNPTEAETPRPTTPNVDSGWGTRSIKERSASLEKKLDKERKLDPSYAAAPEVSGQSQFATRRGEVINDPFAQSDIDEKYAKDRLTSSWNERTETNRQATIIRRPPPLGSTRRKGHVSEEPTFDETPDPEIDEEAALERDYQATNDPILRSRISKRLAAIRGWEAPAEEEAPAPAPRVIPKEYEAIAPIPRGFEPLVPKTLTQQEQEQKARDLAQAKQLREKAAKLPPGAEKNRNLYMASSLEKNYEEELQKTVQANLSKTQEVRLRATQPSLSKTQEVGKHHHHARSRKSSLTSTQEPAVQAAPTRPREGSLTGVPPKPTSPQARVNPPVPPKPPTALEISNRKMELSSANKTLDPAYEYQKDEKGDFRIVKKQPKKLHWNENYLSFNQLNDAQKDALKRQNPQHFGMAQNDPDARSIPYFGEIEDLDSPGGVEPPRLFSKIGVPQTVEHLDPTQSGRGQVFRQKSSQKTYVRAGDLTPAQRDYMLNHQLITPEALRKARSENGMINIPQAHATPLAQIAAPARPFEQSQRIKEPTFNTPGWQHGGETEREEQQQELTRTQRLRRNRWVPQGDISIPENSPIRNLRMHAREPEQERILNEIREDLYNAGPDNIPHAETRNGLPYQEAPLDYIIRNLESFVGSAHQRQNLMLFRDMINGVVDPNYLSMPLPQETIDAIHNISDQERDALNTWYEKYAERLRGDQSTDAFRREIGVDGRSYGTPMREEHPQLVEDLIKSGNRDITPFNYDGKTGRLHERFGEVGVDERDADENEQELITMGPGGERIKIRPPSEPVIRRPGPDHNIDQFILNDPSIPFGSGLQPLPQKKKLADNPIVKGGLRLFKKIAPAHFERTQNFFDRANEDLRKSWSEKHPTDQPYSLEDLDDEPKPISFKPKGASSDDDSFEIVPPPQPPKGKPAPKPAPRPKLPTSSDDDAFGDFDIVGPPEPESGEPHDDEYTHGTWWNYQDPDNPEPHPFSIPTGRDHAWEAMSPVERKNWLAQRNAQPPAIPLDTSPDPDDFDEDGHELSKKGRAEKKVIHHIHDQRITLDEQPGSPNEFNPRHLQQRATLFGKMKNFGKNAADKISQGVGAIQSRLAGQSRYSETNAPDSSDDDNLDNWDAPVIGEDGFEVIPEGGGFKEEPFDDDLKRRIKKQEAKWPEDVVDWKRLGHKARAEATRQEQALSPQDKKKWYAAGGRYEVSPDHKSIRPYIPTPPQQTTWDDLPQASKDAAIKTDFKLQRRNPEAFADFQRQGAARKYWLNDRGIPTAVVPGATPPLVRSNKPFPPKAPTHAPLFGMTAGAGGDKKPGSSSSSDHSGDEGPRGEGGAFGPIPMGPPKLTPDEGRPPSPDAGPNPPLFKTGAAPSPPQPAPGPQEPQLPGTAYDDLNKLQKAQAAFRLHTMTPDQELQFQNGGRRFNIRAKDGFPTPIFSPTPLAPPKRQSRHTTAEEAIQSTMIPRPGKAFGELDPEQQLAADRILNAMTSDQFRDYQQNGARFNVSQDGRVEPIYGSPQEPQEEAPQPTPAPQTGKSLKDLDPEQQATAKQILNGLPVGELQRYHQFGGKFDVDEEGNLVLTTFTAPQAPQIGKTLNELNPEQQVVAKQILSGLSAEQAQRYQQFGGKFDVNQDGSLEFTPSPQPPQPTPPPDEDPMEAFLNRKSGAPDSSDEETPVIKKAPGMTPPPDFEDDTPINQRNRRPIPVPLDELQGEQAEQARAMMTWLQPGDNAAYQRFYAQERPMFEIVPGRGNERQMRPIIPPDPANPNAPQPNFPARFFAPPQPPPRPTPKPKVNYGSDRQLSYNQLPAEARRQADRMLGDMAEKNPGLLEEWNSQETPMFTLFANGGINIVQPKPKAPALPPPAEPPKALPAPTPPQAPKLPNAPAKNPPLFTAPQTPPQGPPQPQKSTNLAMEELTQDQFKQAYSMMSAMSDKESESFGQGGSQFRVGPDGNVIEPIYQHDTPSSRPAPQAQPQIQKSFSQAGIDQFTPPPQDPALAYKEPKRQEAPAGAKFSYGKRPNRQLSSSSSDEELRFPELPIPSLFKQTGQPKEQPQAPIDVSMGDPENLPKGPVVKRRVDGRPAWIAEASEPSDEDTTHIDTPPVGPPQMESKNPTLFQTAKKPEPAEDLRTTLGRQKAALDEIQRQDPEGYQRWLSQNSKNRHFHINEQGISVPTIPPPDKSAPQPEQGPGPEMFQSIKPGDSLPPQAQPPQGGGEKTLSISDLNPEQQEEANRIIENFDYDQYNSFSDNGGTFRVLGDGRLEPTFGPPRPTPQVPQPPQAPPASANPPLFQSKPTSELPVPQIKTFVPPQANPPQAQPPQQPPAPPQAPPPPPQAQPPQGQGGRTIGLAEMDRPMYDAANNIIDGMSVEQADAFANGGMQFRLSEDGQNIEPVFAETSANPPLFQNVLNKPPSEQQPPQPFNAGGALPPQSAPIAPPQAPPQPPQSGFEPTAETGEVPNLWETQGLTESQRTPVNAPGPQGIPTPASSGDLFDETPQGDAATPFTFGDGDFGDFEPYQPEQPPQGPPQGPPSGPTLPDGSQPNPSMYASQYGYPAQQGPTLPDGSQPDPSMFATQEGYPQGGDDPQFPPLEPQGPPEGFTLPQWLPPTAAAAFANFPAGTPQFQNFPTTANIPPPMQVPHTGGQFMNQTAEMASGTVEMPPFDGGQQPPPQNPPLFGAVAGAGGGGYPNGPGGPGPGGPPGPPSGRPNFPPPNGGGMPGGPGPGGGPPPPPGGGGPPPPAGPPPDGGQPPTGPGMPGISKQAPPGDPRNIMLAKQNAGQPSPGAAPVGQLRPGAKRGKFQKKVKFGGDIYLARPIKPAGGNKPQAPVPTNQYAPLTTKSKRQPEPPHDTNGLPMKWDPIGNKWVIQNANDILLPEIHYQQDKLNEVQQRANKGLNVPVPKKKKTKLDLSSSDEEILPGHEDDVDWRHHHYRFHELNHAQQEYVKEEYNLSDPKQMQKAIEGRLRFPPTEELLGLSAYMNAEKRMRDDEDEFSDFEDDGPTFQGAPPQDPPRAEFLDEAPPALEFHPTTSAKAQEKYLRSRYQLGEDPGHPAFSYATAHDVQKGGFSIKPNKDKPLMGQLRPNIASVEGFSARGPQAKHISRGGTYQTIFDDVHKKGEPDYQPPVQIFVPDTRRHSNIRTRASQLATDKSSPFYGAGIAVNPHRSGLKQDFAQGEAYRSLFPQTTGIMSYEEKKKLRRPVVPTHRVVNIGGKLYRSDDPDMPKIEGSTEHGIGGRMKRVFGHPSPPYRRTQ